MPAPERSIIGPIFFVKIRAILDSKYIDYRLNRINSNRFPDFCSGHLKHYQISASEKKLYLMTRQPS